ncbi:flagellar basal body-associated protein FliL [Jannaschia ovalis]|uniref:Flagellar basal body-associated protein FliL n=1 Tax=Jannaschia ovalis TaxID=3038773 RepID=A0ABY8LGA5_9RHOB|nr:flagellar basal body-associated protein FliL [Jannaschia sp. GRR-S6-38]WGH80176.1 flagellar basal body-associated protein FliL [Jannaschia sp. GRR-S6-38]
MMGKLLPVLLVLAALAGGGVAGHALRPAPPEGEPEPEAEPVRAEVPEDERFVTFREAFIVPVLRDGRLWGNVILNLGVEGRNVGRDAILLREPLLRDGLTEALFRHGSLGGFDGNFTEALAMNGLRLRLNEVARALLDDPEARVLIVSMARQDA